MLLKQPRPHFLPCSSQSAINLARKDTTTVFQRHALYDVPLKNSNLKRNKKIKTCFHICLEGKKNETVGLILTFFGSRDYAG